MKETLKEMTKQEMIRFSIFAVTKRKNKESCLVIQKVHNYIIVEHNFRKTQTNILQDVQTDW